VRRLLARHGLMRRDPEAPTDADRRRFAFAKAGELWMSDVMHGPSVLVGDRTKRKSYLIAFLDEATRVVPFAAFALAENTQAFLPIFKQALMRRGLPQRLYVDYVARHIIDVMCPPPLCSGPPGGARRSGRCSRMWPHNAHSDCSHFSSDGSSCQIGRVGDPTPSCIGGWQARRAACFMAVVISA
jgi:hypothetical protein